MPVRHSTDVQAQAVKGARKTSIQVLIPSQEGPHFAMRRFVIQRGGMMPKHTNTVEHEQFILRGQARVSIDMEVYLVKAGDVVFIPEGVPHEYVNDGDEDFEFLCMIPNKQDEMRILEEEKSC